MGNISFVMLPLPVEVPSKNKTSVLEAEDIMLIEDGGARGHRVSYWLRDQIDRETVSSFV